MVSTKQHLCAVLALACIALPACMLFPPSQLSTAAAALLQHQHSMLQDLQDFPRHLSTLTHVQQQTAQAAEAVHIFTIENDRFVLDGQQVQLLSGSIHYHRIPPDQWVDRLSAVKAMGLNAIQVGTQWLMMLQLLRPVVAWWLHVLHLCLTAQFRDLTEWQVHYFSCSMHTQAGIAGNHQQM